MPIISRIGRDSPKVRLLTLAIFALLITGAISMVYPFLLMLAGTTKSNVDKAEMRVVPSYLVDDEALWRKHVEGLFNESLVMMKQTYNREIISFEKLTPPAEPNRKFVDAWRAFLVEAKPPFYTYAIGYIHTPLSRRAAPTAMRQLKRRLIDRFDGDMERVNKELNTDFVDWTAFWAQPRTYRLRRDKPLDTPFGAFLREFKADQPMSNRYYTTVEGFFRYEFCKTQYTRDIAEYNKEHGTNHKSYDEVHLDRRLPAGPGRSDREKTDWEEFVRTIVNLFWIRADPEAAPIYRKFLQAKYGDVATLNLKRNYATTYKSFDDVPLITEPPSGGLPLSDWDAFLQGWKDPDTGVMHMLPAERIHIHSLDFIFRDWLKAKYGTVEQANAALGTSFGGWLDVLPPQEDAHWFDFLGRTGPLRREFTYRNFAAVIDYIVLHGRGIMNTAIYCALAVLSSLLVNPLAAYALSRYKPPSSYKVLLFLMLTMAFPPMVGMIPAFLMLREFNLLNTFAALILPGMANGYAIFLLKGFFDSQPKELYESAALDGAGEFRIFWQITMSLSKPILAVIALGAFNGAYSNFMMALLICQDKKMWTLMVWLYELQRDSGTGVIYASLIIAALPIFLMFVFCQNIIMRGIVVPVEK
ncbi:MAG TPA: ABC transporter permease subunit [Phycisphaerae bacterium]|nr:ABC transporter permease subunit [Phycisphaerae bacterium]